MSDAVALAIAAAQAEYNRGRLQLERDQFEQVTRPTFTDVTRPGAVSGLTGFLMDRPDLYGNLAGGPTFGAQSSYAEMFGQAGSQDSAMLRALGYDPNQRTLGGRQLDLQGDKIRGDYEHQDRLFDASRSDADRLYAEEQRLAFQDQASKDVALEAQYGQAFINGQPVPDYLAPHADWARQFVQQNGGRLPTFTDVVAALAPYGQTPQDYNGGRPYRGQPQVIGPGVVNDPARGGYVDVVSGKPMNQTEAMGVIQNRQGYANAYNPTGGQQAGDEGMMRSMGGMQTGAPAASRGLLPGDTGGGYAQSAGAATAGNFQGSLRDIDQRRLEEQGRQADMLNQVQRQQADADTLRAQADQLRAEAQVRQSDGTLAIDRSKETRADELERRAQGLDEEIKRGTLSLEQSKFAEGQRQFDARLGFDQGVQTGSINGQDTLGRGELLGRFNGQSTLAGQTAYGGSGFVDSGQTLESQKLYGGMGVGNGQTLEAQQALGYVGGQSTLARQQFEADAAIKAAQTAAEMRADPFALEQYRRGLSSSGVPNIIAAVGGRGYLPQTQGGHGGAPAPMSIGNAVTPRTGYPTFGAMPANVIPMQQVAGAGAQGFTPMAGQPNRFGGAMQPPQLGAPVASLEQQAGQLGALNKINAKAYYAADPSGRRYVNSAYKFGGQAADDDDVQDAALKALPGYARRRAGPTFGRMVA